ncbi:hypothetical protein XM25_07715 [Devosia sp. H5989]|nr:hypothetical protein XM25_07715 [Devosia sp. H5989]
MFTFYSLGMSESKSNMPEMEWRPAATGGVVAYPNGDQHQEQYLLISAEQRERPVGGRRFDWFIHWEGRFHGMHGSPTLEEAKRSITEAWWLAIERTEDWRPGDLPLDLYPRSDPYAGVDWSRAARLHEEFRAKMKRLHDERIAERAAKRKLAKATELGRQGMIGPPDPRRGRIWKPKA